MKLSEFSGILKKRSLNLFLFFQERCHFNFVETQTDRSFLYTGDYDILLEFCYWKKLHKVFIVKEKNYSKKIHTRNCMGLNRDLANDNESVDIGPVIP